MLRKLKKSRACQHGTRKIKGHISTKYKEHKPKPNPQSLANPEHHMKNQTLHTNIKPINKPINFKPKFEKPVNKPRNFKPIDLIETHWSVRDCSCRHNRRTFPSRNSHKRLRPHQSSGKTRTCRRVGGCGRVGLWEKLVRLGTSAADDITRLLSKSWFDAYHRHSLSTTPN